MLDKTLGYYQVGNKEFGSKIQACLYAGITKLPIHWNFNNEIFSKWNWGIEPEETLKELYRQRAQDIRNRYEYVILSYSGGADSHNALMSFLDNNIRIDEIIVNTTEAGYKYTKFDSKITSAENCLAEHQLQVLPRLKEIKKINPEIKITILDLSEHLFKELNSSGDASWVIKKREGLNPLGATRFNYLHFKEVRKRFDWGKKIALVLGIEKPKTFLDKNDDLYIQFNDRAANVVTVSEYYEEYPNSQVEYFYWNPNSMKLMTKQGHTIKNWLKLNPEHMELWRAVSHSHRFYRTIQEPLLRKIIYENYWNDSWYQTEKSVGDWYSEFDMWFIEGYKETKENQIWKEGIQYIKKNIESKYLNIWATGIIDGLVSFNYKYKIGSCGSNFKLR